jgi:hypothetical protein
VAGFAYSHAQPARQAKRLWAAGIGFDFGSRLSAFDFRQLQGPGGGTLSSASADLYNRNDPSKPSWIEGNPIRARADSGAGLW